MFCWLKRTCQIHHVVEQLEPRPEFLFVYLDALFRQDPHIVADFADSQVRWSICLTILV
jgi:hypothetical protein